MVQDKVSIVHGRRNQLVSKCCCWQPACVKANCSQSNYKNRQKFALHEKLGPRYVITSLLRQRQISRQFSERPGEIRAIVTLEIPGEIQALVRFTSRSLAAMVTSRQQWEVSSKQAQNVALSIDIYSTHSRISPIRPAWKICVKFARKRCRKITHKISGYERGANRCCNIII